MFVSNINLPIIIRSVVALYVRSWYLYIIISLYVTCGASLLQIAEVQKAPHSAPSTFLIFTLCVVIICMFLNGSNFVLAVPAMVFAFMVSVT